MDDQLTWGDAEKYYRAGENTNRGFAPERVALIEADLATGKDSLIVQYLILRMGELIQSKERFEQLSPDEAMKHVARISRKLSTSHPDAGKDFEMPLVEKIAKMREEKGTDEISPRGDKPDDSREKSRYDLDGGGWGRS